MPYDFKETVQPFKIPENASLKDIIEVLNKMKLVVHLDDLDNKQWIYEHKDWFVDT